MGSFRPQGIAAFGRLALVVVASFLQALPSAAQAQDMPTIKLPPPSLRGPVSLEEALTRRRSIREYADTPMGLPDIGQLLWAAQGSTTDERRTVPSAGALYPLEIYLVVGRVEDLPAGVYRYRPDTHDLQRESAGDVRRELADAAHEQEWVAAAPAVVVLAVVYERSTAKYGERGVRYAHMEVGHAAQNVYLEAAAQGLATVEVGAFHDERVAKVLGLKSNIRPVALMPVGKS